MKSRIRADNARRPRVGGLVPVVVSALLLAGCAATSGSAGQTGTPAPAPANAVSVEPVPAAAEGSPSASARMVCGDETRTNIIRILSLPTTPRTTEAWADKLYTCTYALASGSLVLSVKEATDPASAHSYFDWLASAAVSGHPIEGMANLGLPAFQTSAGAVVFVKDNFILTVDATGLPVAVGPHGVTRGAFAYEVATAVLACWSE